MRHARLALREARFAAFHMNRALRLMRKASGQPWDAATTQKMHGILADANWRSKRSKKHHRLSVAMRKRLDRL